MNFTPQVLKYLDELIFFDEIWMFADGDEGNEKIEEYKKISKIIVDELNKNLIEPHDFENSFKKIVKELFLTSYS